MNESFLWTWAAMEGKTIRKSVQYPTGKYGHEIHVAIIFEDDTYALLETTPDGPDNAYIGLRTDMYCGRAESTLADYLHPQELLDCNMVNIGQYEYLMAKRDEDERKEKTKRLAKLHAEAEKLSRELVP